MPVAAPSVLACVVLALAVCGVAQWFRKFRSLTSSRQSELGSVLGEGETHILHESSQGGSSNWLRQDISIVHAGVNLADRDSPLRHVVLDPQEDGIQVLDFAKSPSTSYALSGGGVHQDVYLHLDSPVRQGALFS